jgi:NADPH:quinone reductase-like Zn-dependent oxidoreductase
MTPENSAVVGNGPGQAAVLAIPYPSLPGPDWVIIRTTAVALNPIDYKHLFFPGEGSVEGAVLGHDFAGVVEEVGEGVVNVKKGERVAGAVNGS